MLNQYHRIGYGLHPAQAPPGTRPLESELLPLVRIGQVDQIFGNGAFTCWQKVARRLVNRDSELASAKYPLSIGHPLQLNFPAEYRQILMQRFANQGEIEYDYTVPLEPEVVNSILAVFGSCFRCRLTLLPAGAIVPWHADIESPLGFRFLVPIFGESMLEWRKDEQSSGGMLKPGQVWFLRWESEHRIIAHYSDPRVVIAFSCYFDPLPEWIRRKIIQPDAIEKWIDA